MSTLANRLDRVMPALSGKERAILVLRNFKEGRPQDPGLARGITPADADAHNRLIGLMNVANLRLSHLITFIEGEVEKLELRLALWFALRLWEVNLAEIDYCASVVAREAITESEHSRLVEKAEKQYVPVAECARVLAELERAWADDELEEVGWLKERFVKDAAWRRLCKEAEDRIRAAVAAGELEGRGAGKKLAVRRGSFDARLGRPVTVYPAWVGGYEVLPDHQAAQVSADRHTLGLLRDAIVRTPLERRGAEQSDGEPSGLSGLIEGMQGRIRLTIVMRWSDVRLAELALDEIAAEFDGEDPLKRHTREALDWAKQTLLSVVRQIEVYSEPLELVEPSEADLQEMRDQVEKWSRN